MINLMIKIINHDHMGRSRSLLKVTRGNWDFCCFSQFSGRASLLWPWATNFGDPQPLDRVRGGRGCLAKTRSRARRLLSGPEQRNRLN